MTSDNTATTPGDQEESGDLDRGEPNSIPSSVDDGISVVSFEADPSMSPTAARIYELLAPVVATVDVELLDVDWTGGTLQVVVDNPDGVTIDSLATVNRLISPILDQHDPIAGRYTLEVSSPGVERPLRRAAHYLRAIGEQVIIKTEPHVTPRRLKGTLTAVSGGSLVMAVTEIDGVDLVEVEERSVPTADIASARTVFEWGPTPKKGGKANQNKGGQKKAKNNPAGKKAKNNPANDKPAKNKTAKDVADKSNTIGGSDGDNQIEQDRKEVDDE